MNTTTVSSAAPPVLAPGVPASGVSPRTIAGPRSADRWFRQMPGFALVGAFGAVLNLVIMWALLGWGMHYLPAAILATELTILSNFIMHERLVFRQAREGRPFRQRLIASLGFNNAEALVRMPVLVLLVDLLLVPDLAAQAATLVAAFVVRFVFTSRVIYRTRPCPAPVPYAPQGAALMNATADVPTAPAAAAPREQTHARQLVEKVGCHRCAEVRYGAPSCN